jgi:hypothetical protein
VKAGIEGVIGGRFVLKGEKGPAPLLIPPLTLEKGRGGGIVIREGAAAFCRRIEGEVLLLVGLFCVAAAASSDSALSVDFVSIVGATEEGTEGCRGCIFGEGDPIGA